MGRVGHNNMGASNALYDRSLLDWRKAQKTKASFGGTGVASMKVGDLVKHRNTGFAALVTREPRSASELSMVKVLTTRGPGMWRRQHCEVISESR